MVQSATKWRLQECSQGPSCFGSLPSHVSFQLERAGKHCLKQIDAVALQGGCLPWGQRAQRTNMSWEGTANVLCPTTVPHSLCRGVHSMSSSSAFRKKTKNKVV